MKDKIVLPVDVPTNERVNKRAPKKDEKKKWKEPPGFFHGARVKRR